MTKIRLRDFVEFKGCYFSVVSYRNDDGVKCLLRYIKSQDYQDCQGQKICQSDTEKVRKLGEKTFVKLSHSESLRFFKEYQKDGIFVLPKVDKVFKPEVLTPKIEKVDEQVRRVSELFSFIPRTHKGVTGSRLLRLNSKKSDVDFVVYGNWWFKAREHIKRKIESGEIDHPNERIMKKIYKKRNPSIDYEIFVAHELRKYHRAVVDDTYFDLLYVRDYEKDAAEFPEKKGVKIGFAEIEAEVVDDSKVFDYPAYYPVRNVKVKEFKEANRANEINAINATKLDNKIHAVLSFTHTYVGQAFKGEKIRAYGCVECIDGKNYLIVGTRRESDEYIVSLNVKP